jgi:HAD superfamily hydrolase (TIGR01509 family)
MTDIDLIAPPEPFSAIIFDCDGTLADTMPTHFEAWLSALRSFGADMNEDEFYGWAGVPTDGIIAALNERYGYTLDIRETHSVKERKYKELVHSVEEIKAVTDIVRKYHGRLPMAVASGGTRDIVDATLTATGLVKFFDVIVTAGDVVHGKPAPDIFLLAAEKLGVDAKDCVVYEDGEPGIVGAKAAGMRVIDVRVMWGGAHSPSMVETR